MKIQRVLCPTDFSDTSLKALRHAATIAQWYEASLHVLHVMSEGLAPVAISGIPLSTEVTQELQRKGDAALREWIDDVRLPGAAPVLTVLSGHAVEGILGYARESAIDMIVLGTHGRSGIDRMLIGSVAERVLHHAPCPVLTIPPTAEPAARHPAMKFERILYATDFSPSSDAALTLALSLAQENQSALTLLHVLDALNEADVETIAHYRIADYLRLRKEEAAVRLKALVPEAARDWARLDERLEVGPPAKTILRVAGELKADLICMGAQGHSDLTVAIFGSSTQTVVRRAACPVLTVSAGSRRSSQPVPPTA